MKINAMKINAMKINAMKINAMKINQMKLHNFFYLIILCFHRYWNNIVNYNFFTLNIFFIRF